MCKIKVKFYTLCQHVGDIDDLHYVSICDDQPQGHSQTQVNLLPKVNIPAKCPYCRGDKFSEPLKTPSLQEGSPMGFPQFTPQASSAGGGLWPNAPNTPPPRKKHDRFGQPNTPISLRYAPSPDSPTPKMSAKMMRNLSASKLSGMGGLYDTAKTPSKLGGLFDGSSSIDPEENRDDMDCDSEAIAVDPKKNVKNPNEGVKSPIITRSRSKQLGLHL